MTKCTTTHNDDQVNILINNSLRACLTGFDLSTMAGVERHIVDNASFITVVSEVPPMSSNASGTLQWMSPELLVPDLFGISDSRLTKRSDCYALGMVVYEVFAGVLVPTFTKV